MIYRVTPYGYRNTMLLSYYEDAGYVRMRYSHYKRFRYQLRMLGDIFQIRSKLHGTLYQTLHQPVRIDQFYTTPTRIFYLPL